MVSNPVDDWQQSKSDINDYPSILVPSKASVAVSSCASCHWPPWDRPHCLKGPVKKLERMGSDDAYPREEDSLDKGAWMTPQPPCWMVPQVP